MGSWQELLADVLKTEEFSELSRKIDREYENHTIFPPKDQVFTAFSLTPPERVRVVILGQDPYHEPNQAHGLAFSVRSGVKLPPSLLNIYKERQTDVGVPMTTDGDLTHWAKQGVFLLNAVLTVEQGKANSHKNHGWQAFTDQVVAAIARLPQPVAFVLWGAQAPKKAKTAANSPYPRLVLQSPHPSPLSSYRGFFGSQPFSQINGFLREHGEEPIRW